MSNPQNTEKVELSPGNYTQFRNPVLEAMMRRGEPPSQRLIACMARYSWGVGGSKFVVSEKKIGARAATLVDIAGLLEVSKQFTTKLYNELESKDWMFQDEEGRYYLNENPHPPVVKKEPDNAEEALPPGCPTREEFKAEKFPRLPRMRQRLNKYWAYFRKLDYAADKAYEELLKEYGEKSEVNRNTEKLKNPQSTATLEKESVAVDCAPPPSLFTERKKDKLASYDPAADEETGKQAAEDLAAGIAALQQRNIWSRLDPPSAQTILNLMKVGTAREVTGFLLNAWNERRNHWKGWGIVVTAAREEIPALRVKYGPPPPAPEPEPEIPLAQKIAMALDLAESPEWANHVDRPRFEADLAELERDHPDEVRRIREHPETIRKETKP